MKAIDMTNEELSDYIVNVIGGGIFKEYYAEAAERLRKADDVKTAYDRAVSADACQAIENESLRRRLKVAEDALDKIFHLVFVDCEVAMVAKEALAAIREEGVAK